jgi:polygalacturonase
LLLRLSICALAAVAHAAELRDFGVAGDGATDDTAAIQKAVDSGLGEIRF